jgi:hypothetical protein
MRPSLHDDQAEKDREFVLEALRTHFRGDMQLVFRHLNEFLASPAVAALLDKKRALQQEIFQVWEMEGFGKTAPIREATGPETQETQGTQGTLPVSPNLQPRSVVLPNGKMGQPYHFDLSLAFPELLTDGGCSLIVAGLEDEGMYLEAHLPAIGGTPEAQGDHSLQFTFFQSGQAAEHYEATFHIIPDPRLLWKEVEPSESLPFFRMHEHVQIVTGLDKSLYAASRRGRSHAHNGAFREDAFDLHYLPDDESSDLAWQFAAVSDGAGSAKYSRKGSEIACQDALYYLYKNDLGPLQAALDRHSHPGATPFEVLADEQVRATGAEILGKAAQNAWQAIRVQAEEMQEDISAFHATLLLTVIRKCSFGWWIGAWWVGDGAIALYREGESVQLLGNPDGGQFAGQTRFLTSPEIWQEDPLARERFSMAVVDDFTALFLMTDGVTDPLFQTDHNLRQVAHWDAFWRQFRESVKLSPFGGEKMNSQLLDWLNFWSKGNHDDRTICILY